MNPIEGIDEEWSKYRNEDELGIKYTPKGKLSYYEGGGFVKDFDKDLNYEEFRLEIDRLIKFDFLNDETAAIFVQFTSYLPYSNIWIYNHLMLERNLQNQLMPSEPKQYVFIPNIYHGEIGQNSFVLDIIRFVLALLMIAFLGFYIMKKEKIKDKLLYIFIEIGALNLSVSGMTIASVIFSWKQTENNYSPQDLVNQIVYIDLFEEADNYMSVSLFQTLTLMMILLRVSVILKMNDRLNIIFLTFNKALLELLAFLLMTFPVMIGFTFVFQKLWSPYFEGYTSFSKSLAMTLLMAQGNFDIEAFSKYSPIFSIIFILIFYFFVIFFIIAVFQAFLIECYRVVIMEVGYPQEKQTVFQLKDIFIWLFSWILCLCENSDEEDEDSQEGELSESGSGNDEMVEENQRFVQKEKSQSGSK